MSMNPRRRLPLLFTIAFGLTIGTVDFISTDFRPALLLTALAGGLLGYLFPQRRWSLAVWLGLFVPVAIVFGMAAGHRPARGHFVLIDARTIVPALLGAAFGGQMRGKRRSGDQEAEQMR